LGFNPSVDGKGDVMAKYIICGKNNLSGQIEVPGNKNSALPILAATLLTKEDCILENVPVISDVLVMCQILQDLGVQINGVGTHKLVINTKNVNNGVLNDELVGRLRASVLLLGPLLARFGEAKMRHPGGCIIGRRAVGTHFDALETLGAKTITTDTHYESKLDKPAPGYIFLDEASVTATENVLMLASLMPGTTTIQDAACEPHIVDLAKFLKSMGAHITGEGTNKITIDAVGK
jgi:UDP-N-acetylglucosamine 1-carboxyvinyltransferase